MKPKMRTRQWLATARQHAGLSQVELARLAGLKSTIILSLYEAGKNSPSSRTWAALEDALRPLAPLMFVDEEALIATVEAGARWGGEDELCRLIYVRSRHGIAFTDVKPVKGEIEGFFITLSVTEASELLREQGKWFDDAFGTFDAFGEKESEDDRPADCEGGELKQRRKALGLDQRAVARMLSASQPAISLLERGLENPPDLMRRYRELLERLAEESQTK